MVLVSYPVDDGYDDPEGSSSQGAGNSSFKTPSLKAEPQSSEIYGYMLEMTPSREHNGFWLKTARWRSSTSPVSHGFVFQIMTQYEESGLEIKGAEASVDTNPIHHHGRSQEGLPHELLAMIVRNTADWVGLESLILTSPPVTALFEPGESPDAPADSDAISLVKEVLQANPVMNSGLECYFYMCAALRRRSVNDSSLADFLAREFPLSFGGRRRSDGLKPPGNHVLEQSM
ncbi:hypothetical protein BO86DRAFT_394309 [Aspergillus japonicus CBS 114.51]|uniref:Uncharacterized protein n=2 Tax=Aspergillus TaxID=5052 RepID=A0A2V5I5C7_ASPV1|nr:hypothetical protein BO86DRAFT_394309 [Aspergillus japonicus CBS 114.51]PYI19317.1 hypothetical protein BO99DRAFT_432642 [Aspergillus violaceofuscus CBS 115571]RAH87511.1 hypothetical protein BO86DRAFT_394309 [Aspergillus japonicus CBS 114.51]